MNTNNEWATKYLFMAVIIVICFVGMYKIVDLVFDRLEQMQVNSMFVIEK